MTCLRRWMCLRGLLVRLHLWVLGRLVVRLDPADRGGPCAPAGPTVAGSISTIVCGGCTATTNLSAGDGFCVMMMVSVMSASPPG